ncbi:MAG: glycosyltransferase [bacterium]|nr:glycosyltransferase [bacterium]
MINVLINGIVIGEGSILPISLRAKYWQLHGCHITYFGTSALKDEIVSDGRIKNYGFIEFKGDKGITTKINFMFEMLRRNIIALGYIKDTKNKYNYIHSISSQLNFIIFPFVLKFFDRKIKWVTVFDNIVPLFDPGNKFLRFLAWFFFQISLVLLKKADTVFVISPDLRDFLLRHGLSKNKVVVTGNGIDVELMKQAKKDPEYNIDALFVGRINETKGIYDMLKVLEIMVQKYPDFMFAVMGLGDKASEKQFKNQINQMQLTNNVQFLGYRKGLEKFNIIKSSKCFWFLSVSESESFGIALLEAVCLGLPALVYDLDPFKKIYRNNEVFMFEKHDYKAVTKKTLEIFINKEFINRKGKMLMEDYGWDKIAKIELDHFNLLYEKN